MATYSSLVDLFTAIAGVIRDREGSTDSIVASDFPERIENLPSGGQNDGTFTLHYLAGETVSYVDPTDGTLHVDTFPSSAELELPIAQSSQPGYAVFGLRYSGSTGGFSETGFEIGNGSRIGGITRSKTMGNSSYGVLYNNSLGSVGVLYVASTLLRNGDSIIIS